MSKSLPSTPFPGEALNAAGLNRHAIFAREALPNALLATLPQDEWRQLILLGHGGRRLWDAVQAAKIASDDPIDTFTVNTAKQVFSGQLRHVIYPGPAPVGLQALGQLAGWHQASPFMVGIDHDWGTWFAYRAVLLTDSTFLPSPPVDREHIAHPCVTCPQHLCETACPAGALAGMHGNTAFALEKCLHYRQQADSRCATTCQARLACPLGSEHRYSEAQMHHSYSISLRYIRQWNKG